MTVRNAPWTAALALQVALIGVAGCNNGAANQPATGTTPVKTAASASPGTSGNAASRVLDDPTGLVSGKALAIGTPPPPLAAAVTAAGQVAASDLSAAMGVDQEMDAYAFSFDRGSDIISAGAGNYRLLEDTAATSAEPESNLPFFDRPEANQPIVTSATIAPGASGAAATGGATGAADTVPADFVPKYHASVSALRDANVQQVAISSLQLQVAHAAQVIQRLAELDKLKKKVAAAPWLANDDGTIVKELVVDLDKQHGAAKVTRHVTIGVTVQQALDLLVHQLTRFEEKLKTGVRVTSNREVVLLGDGSQHVELTYQVLRPNGARRVVSWTKTIDAAGNVTGSGTVQVFDKAKTLVRSFVIQLQGTDSSTTIRADDANTALSARVTLDESGAASASMHDASGATATLAASAVALPPADPSDDPTELGAESAASAAATAAEEEDD